MKSLMMMLISLCLLSACEKADETDAACSPAQCPVNTLKFKTATGFDVADWDQLVSVRVRIFKQPATNTAPSGGFIEREFFAEDAYRVLERLNLNAPTQAVTMATQVTGEISLTYISEKASSTQTRSFFILSGREIQDEDYPEILYKPAAVLTQAWLTSL